MFRALPFAIGLLCTVLPSLGSAADLQVRTTSALSLDTVGPRAQDRVAFRLGVPVELRGEPTVRSRANLSYRPVFDLEPTRGWGWNVNHGLTAAGTYSLSPRATAAASLRFDDLGFIPVDATPNPDSTFDQAARIRRISTSLSLSYALSSRWSFGALLAHNANEFEDIDRNDSQNVNAAFDLDYALTRDDRLALAVDVSRSIFDASLRAQGQDVTNVRLSLRWNHDFNEHLKLRVNLGPTFSLFETDAFPSVLFPRYPMVQVGGTNFFVKYFDCLNDDSPCTATPATNPINFPPGSDPSSELVSTRVDSEAASDRQVNFFGTVGLSYIEARWHFNLEFRRTQSNQSGLGTSTAVNALRLGVDWRASDRWSLRLQVRATQRKSLTESSRLTGEFLVRRSPTSPPYFLDADMDEIAEIDSLKTQIAGRPIDIKQASVTLNLSRRVTRKLSLTGALLYTYDDRIVNGASTGRGRVRVQVGFSYSFTPVHL